MKAIPILAILGVVVTCKAAVIQNDAIIIPAGTSPHFFTTSTFSVNSAGFLMVSISGSGSSFTFSAQGIADAYSLFQVNYEDKFNVEFANTQTSFVNNWSNPGPSVLNLALGQSAYLAYWDQGSGPPRLIAQEQDVFGWAQLTNSNGILVVTESATALGGGIKVGTLQQIPESNTTTVVGLGIALLCLRRRRQFVP